MKKYSLSLIALLLIMTSAFGQDSGYSGKVWSIKDCMQYAIDNSPKRKIQDATNDDRRLSHREAYLNWVPSISGSTSASSNFGRSIDPETNIYTNTATFSNSYSASASYTIFNGFSVVNNYRITKIARLSGVEELQQIKDDLCLQVIQAYYNVLYKTEMVNITREQLSESNKSLKQTRVMLELGLKGQADLLQVEAKVAADDFNYVKEQNALEDAKITLKSLMFYPLSENLTIDAGIVWIVDPFLSSESPDSIFNSAQSYLPSLKIADYNVRQAELNYMTKKWQILPNIYAQGQISTGYITALGENASKTPFMQQLSNNLGEYVGIGMNIPIFSSLSRWNNKAKMKNALTRAQMEKEQKLQEVETEIQRAVQDMDGAAKEYVQADKRKNAQEMAHKANAKKYDEGLISVIELQTSSNQLLASKAERLNSAFTYMIKAKIVKYYKGIPYIEQ